MALKINNSDHANFQARQFTMGSKNLFGRNSLWGPLKRLDRFAQWDMEELVVEFPEVHDVAWRLKPDPSKDQFRKLIQSYVFTTHQYLNLVRWLLCFHCNLLYASWTSVRPKFGFDIGNRNQGPISVSEPKFFFPKPKLFFSNFTLFFLLLGGNTCFRSLKINLALQK